MTAAQENAIATAFTLSIALVGLGTVYFVLGYRYYKQNKAERQELLDITQQTIDRNGESKQILDIAKQTQERLQGNLDGLKRSLLSDN